MICCRGFISHPWGAITCTLRVPWFIEVLAITLVEEGRRSFWRPELAEPGISGKAPP